MHKTHTFSNQQGGPRRGGALAASLALVMLIAGMGVGLVQVISSGIQRQAGSLDSMRALYIAEAGLAESFLAIAQGRDGVIGSTDNLASFAGGYYWVVAESLASGHVRLTCNGLYEHGRSSLAVVVEPKSNPIGSLGISSLGQIEIGAGSVLNAMNSTESNTVGSGVMLRGNGDIILHSNSSASSRESGWESMGSIDDEFPSSTYSGTGATLVDGDVQPGVYGIVEADSSATITGSTIPATQQFLTPPVKFPRGGQDIGNFTINGSSSLSGKQEGDALQVPSGAQLTLLGPLVLVVKSLVADPGANITIDTTNGPVEIFVSTHLDLQHGSTLTNIGQDSTQAALIVGAAGRDSAGKLRVEEQKILSTGVFHGLIYTPYSQLKVGGDLAVTGAISAGQLHLGPGSRLTYDAALKNAGVGVDLLPRQVAWTQESLPDDPIIRSKRDVNQLLDQLGRVSRVSTDAYSTNDASLQYVDKLGINQEYHGDIRAFDFDNLSWITSVAWYESALGGYGQDQRPLIVVKPDSIRSEDTTEALDAVETPL